jgi:hypothetical protein
LCVQPFPHHAVIRKPDEALKACQTANHLTMKRFTSLVRQLTVLAVELYVLGHTVQMLWTLLFR